MRLAPLLLASLASLSLAPRDVPVILTNHLGYDMWGPKRAVIQEQTDDEIGPCRLREETSDDQVAELAPQRAGAVKAWGDWIYWTIDFSEVRREARSISSATTAATASSQAVRHRAVAARAPHALRRHLLLQGQRASGALDAADRTLPFEIRRAAPSTRTAVADATGDYGKHLSHLSFST